MSVLLKPEINRDRAVLWYLRQATVGNVVVLLAESPEDGKHAPSEFRYVVGVGEPPWRQCLLCEEWHVLAKPLTRVHWGNDLELAERCYQWLEDKLVAGELTA